MDNLLVTSGRSDRLWSFFGGPIGRRMARWRMLFEEVEQFERQFEGFTDSESFAAVSGQEW